MGHNVNFRFSSRVYGPAAAAALALTACAGPMQTVSVGARDPVSLARACARSVCRTEVKDLRLVTPDGEPVVIKTELFPYADGGRVSIFTGEAFVVDFADSRGVANPHFTQLLDRLEDTRGLKFAAPGTRPTMSFQLRQDADGPDTMLITNSTLNAVVKFDAEIFVPTPDGVMSMHTSTCPVIAGGGANETWPYPIAMVVLSNFRVLPMNARGFTCE